MNRRLVLSIGPFVLLAVASCGSSSGSNANGGGETSGDGGSPSGGDDATASSSGISGGSSSGVGGSSGGSSGSSSSSGGEDASGGTSGDAGATATSADVPMLHKHINRDGFFVDGALTTSALMGKTLAIDKTFAGTFTGSAYAS